MVLQSGVGVREGCVNTTLEACVNNCYLAVVRVEDLVSHFEFW